MDIYDDPLSNIINHIKVSEIEYRGNLLRLLASCNPSKKDESFCKVIRKLITTHNELNIGNGQKAETDLTNWFGWLMTAIPIYFRYIELLTFKGCIDMEISYRKFPLIRLNYINKLLRVLYDEIDFTKDILAVVNEFQKLLVDAKDKVETENLSLDLSTFKFDNVMSMSSNLNDTGYFNKHEIIRRDYFKLNVIGHELFTNEILVELFKLKNNCIAVCSLEKYGRSMVFPLLKINEFKIYQNDTSLIHLKSKDSKIEFKFIGPDKEQMRKWNLIIKELQNLDNSQFLNKSNRLNTLKNGKLGVGIYTNEIISSVTPTRIFKPHSPNPDSFNLKSKHLDLSLNSKLDGKENFNDGLTDSLLSPQSLPNESISSKTSQHCNTKTSSNLKSCISDTSLRKSSKLIADHESLKETNLELPPGATQEEYTEQSPFLEQNHQQQTESFTPFYAKIMNSTASLPTIQRPLQFENSISSFKTAESYLRSNYDNTSLITPKKTITKRKSIFGLFSKKSTSPKFELVTLQKVSSPQLPSVNNVILANCTKVKSLVNKIAMSRWNEKNQWEIIGSEQNLLEFYVSEEHRIMRFESGIGLTIPINNPKTTITKSNAKDLQIRCLQSMTSSKLIILSIRCKDSKTLSSILQEFENKDSITQSNLSSSDSITPAKSGYTTSSGSVSEASSIKMSKSNCLFDELPSNSTSMSSVSLNDILQPPKFYTNKSSSTLNLRSETSTITSSISVDELLLKRDIKIKLHKLDMEQDWIPVSLGHLSISSMIHNPKYSKFDITLIKSKINTIVQNSSCTRLGKSGVRFLTDDEEGENINYLLEFRNQKECEEIYELLQ